MPNSISFMLTVEQIKRREKTVTRRLGWRHARVGQVLRAVVKVQGLKKGEKQQQLATIRVVDVRREPLNKITADDCAREGFPELTPRQFVTMFCRAMGCARRTVVTRIEFEYLDDRQARLF